jgi:uncharacterized protein
MSHEIVRPVGQQERVRELDVLRGIALFGVVTMNFVGFSGAYILATNAQLAALPTAAIDEWTYFAVRWLIGDKANTMFAVLFGLGFYLQMKRGEGKPGLQRRYARRLFWLLVFGWLNIIFLWAWDILNLYALAGFGLLLMRRWRTRSLVIFGAVAAMYSDKLQERWTSALGVTLIPDWIYNDAAVFERQSAALAGHYPTIIATFWEWTWAEWFAGGMVVAWIVYALGRFALGAAIGRSGIIEDIPRFLPLLKRIAFIAIPVGLVIGFGLRALESDLWAPALLGDYSEPLGEALRAPNALLLAAGYSAAIVVALQSNAGARLLGVFAPVGRMALTNYLAQGLLYGFVLFGVGPGLGLAGQIGSTAVLGICIVFFAFQVVFSRWWLVHFRFGPMEWLWRTLTYGERPPFLLRGRQPATAL